MQDFHPLYIGANAIRNALTYQLLIPEMRKALIAFSSGNVVQPLRTILPVPHQSGRYAVMSAVYGKVMGTKLISVYPENTARNLPTHLSVIHLFHAGTGQPLAILDGDVITAMRTAAVSAIAAELLAPAGARTLAILGAGVQARAHAAALRKVRPFENLYVWSRSPVTAQSFAAEIGALSTTREKALGKADVVVAATGASEPIVRGSLIQRDSLIISVGAVGSHLRELDDEAMDGVLIAESRQAVQQESGDVRLSGATVYAELGELLSGATGIPDTRRFIFKSVGIAVEDVAAAHLVYTLISNIHV